MHPLISCSLTNSWFQDDYMMLSHAWTVGMHNWLYTYYFLRDKVPATKQEETPVDGCWSDCPKDWRHEPSVEWASRKEWGPWMSACWTSLSRSMRIWLLHFWSVCRPFSHLPPHIPQTIPRCRIQMVMQLMASQDHPALSTASCRLR